MIKPVIAATAVLVIAGSSIVYAQHRFGERDGFRPRAEQGYRPSAEDLARSPMPVSRRSGPVSN